MKPSRAIKGAALETTQTHKTQEAKPKPLRVCRQKQRGLQTAGLGKRGIPRRRLLKRISDELGDGLLEEGRTFWKNEW